VQVVMCFFQCFFDLWLTQVEIPTFFLFLAPDFLSIFILFLQFLPQAAATGGRTRPPATLVADGLIVNLRLGKNEIFENSI